MNGRQFMNFDTEDEPNKVGNLTFQFSLRLQALNHRKRGAKEWVLKFVQFVDDQIRISLDEFDMKFIVRNRPLRNLLEHCFQVSWNNFRYIWLIENEHRE